MKSYLRGLEEEFGESSNAIRLELNRFEEAGLLTSDVKGNKKVFQANTQHPLFHEINSIIMKYVGLDQIIEYVVKRMGSVEKVYLTGSFAHGLNSNVIDLILIGEINTQYLLELVEKAEKIIQRKIRYLVFKNDQEYSLLTPEANGTAPLLLWSSTK